MDFAFAGQRSKDQSQDQHFVGLRGKTAYIHIVDHHTGLEVTSARISKRAPTAWVKRWLHQNIPADLPKAKRYVMLDQGGELANNPEFCKMFTSEPFYYDIEPIGADAHQILNTTQRLPLRPPEGLYLSLIHI